MTPRLRPVLGFLVMLLLSGCSWPAFFLRPTALPAPAKIIVTRPAVELTPSEAAPTETPPALFTGSCAWVWANQDLPDLTDQIGRAFQDAGLADVEIRASAYGENCLDPQTNKVARFAAMQTDFYLVIAVKDTADHQAAGEWIARGLNVLAPFVPGKVPGPNPGSIAIRFVSLVGEENLWFQRTTAESLLESGKTGVELYDALR